MIVVHHLNRSRSQRVLWLLEELSLPYKIKRYERDPQTMLAPPALKEVHPLGKSPVITDGDKVFAESGAILEYLVEKAGNHSLKPAPGTPEAERCRYWLHYAEGSLMSPLLLKLVFDQIERAPVPFFVKPIAKQIAKKAKAMIVTPQLKTHLDYIESELNKHLWFAGNELSIADIQMSYPLEAANARVPSLSTRPKVQEFLRRLHERPAYQRALEKGGPVTI